MKYVECEEQISDTQSKPGAMKSLFKDTAPALAVLLLTIAYSFISGEPALSQSWRNVVITFIRLLRFTLMLCIPLYALPCIYSFVLRRKNHALLRTEEGGWETEINPVKHWIYRPLQGIGIGLLFGTKLLSILQVIAGPACALCLLSSIMDVRPSPSAWWSFF